MARDIATTQERSPGLPPRRRTDPGQRPYHRQQAGSGFACPPVAGESPLALSRRYGTRPGQARLDAPVTLRLLA